MRKGFWGKGVLGALILLVISSSVFVAQRPGNRTATPPPAANDLKIKYRMTTAGQPMESTTMLKGTRERSETKMAYGTDIYSITQCDLKRTIQVSDKVRKYVVTPIETADSTGNSGADATVTAQLLPGMLNDPSGELRRDAVQRLLDQAGQSLAATNRDGAANLYRQALSFARCGPG